MRAHYTLTVYFALDVDNDEATLEGCSTPQEKRDIERLVVRTLERGLGRSYNIDAECIDVELKATVSK